MLAVDLATLKMVTNGASLCEYLFSLIHEGQKVALIFRSLPGAGKSFLTNKLGGMLATANINKVRISSADAFFTKNGAKYEESFSIAKLGDAHLESRNNWRSGIASKMNLLISDNTNTSAEEFAWYAHEANDAGYTVIFVTIEAALALCIERNIHLPKARAEAILTGMDATMRAVKLPPFPPFNLHVVIPADR